MANLIIKSSADNLVLKGSDDSPAITVGATGTTTFAEATTLSGGVAGNTTFTENVTFSGWINQNSQNFKMKVVTGTTPGSASGSVAHGLTDSKIVLTQLTIDANSKYYTVAYDPNGSSYLHYFFIEGANIVFTDLAANLQSRPYKLFMIYID